jgi:hypothetical protein
MTAVGAGDPTRRVARFNLGFSLLATVLVGASIRFVPVFSSAFPLNDGGLIARMAADLTHHGFLLPVTTGYNGEIIPFAYPPLGIYLTGLASLALQIGPASVLRWLPAILSTISILAMYAMAVELLRSRWRGVVAAIAFALMPRSYEWLIVGGGITRSLGLLLALLALQQGTRMLRAHRWSNVVVTGMLGGLTALSHPQAALFLAIGLVTLWAFHFRRGRAIRAGMQLVATGLLGLLVASPWLLAVVATHGFAPILSAGRSALDPGIGLGQLLGLAFVDTPVLDLITALGVLGIIMRIARRQWMIPIWLVLIMVSDPRAGATFATVPLALSVVPVVGELLQRMAPFHGAGGWLDSTPMPRLLRSHGAAAVVVTLMLFVGLRTAARVAAEPSGPLHGLTNGHVVAMEWVRKETDEHAKFGVITGRRWESDYISEWFPVMAERISVATVQGAEWTGIDAFVGRLAMFRELQECASRTATCVQEWAGRWATGPLYVFVPKGRLFGPNSSPDCCAALRETLGASDHYSLVYDGPGASIFAPVDLVAAGSPTAGTSR